MTCPYKVKTECCFVTCGHSILCMTGSCFQEEVWSMAGEAAGSADEGRSNGEAEAAQLAPSLSEVHLVEAFFHVEQRLGIAAAAAAHPAALPQVHMCTLLKSHDNSDYRWRGVCVLGICCPSCSPSSGTHSSHARKTLFGDGNSRYI